MKMTNFTIELSVTRRRWYWPFKEVPVRIVVNKRFTATFFQRNAAPVVVKGYATQDGELTTIVSCGYASDAVAKTRYKLVSQR